MLLDTLLENVNLTVEPFAVCHVSEGWRLQLPGPPNALIHFVMQGRGQVLGPRGDRHDIGRGHFAIIPRGAEHALETGARVEHVEDSATPCTGFALPELIAGGDENAPLVVACGLVKMQWGDRGLFDHLIDVLNVDLSAVPAVGLALQGILEEQRSARPGGEVLTTSLMRQCLVHLLRRLSEDSETGLPWLNALSDPRLATAMEKILEDPAADHSVESLADAASMSRSAFAEKFATSIGMTPMNLVTRMRMEQAERLLQQNDMLSIDEVAGKVGISSRSHFSRAFKKHTGLAPAEFRVARKAEPG